MAIQRTPELLPADTELLLAGTVEGKEAVAMGGVYGKNLSEVQAVSTDPDVLVREAMHTQEGVRMALGSAETAIEITLSEAERREMIFHILEINRSERERYLEDRVKTLREQVEHLVQHATPEQLAVFDQLFPAYASVDTDEIRQLIDDEAAQPKTDSFEWARRTASGIGRLARTVLSKTVLIKS